MMTFSHLFKSSLSLLPLIMAGVLFSFTAHSAPPKMVLQVDASLTINQQVEFESAPFVLLEGESSTLAEEGLGGYKVELTAKRNQDKSYALASKIYRYTKSGYTLLGTPMLNIGYQTAGQIEFVSEIAGPVILQLEIVKQAFMTTETDDFGGNVR